MKTPPLAHREYLPKDWTMKDSQAIQSLPKGWRWLELGEMTKVGDYCCDPRAKPVQIIVPYPMVLSTNNHPVRRKITTPLASSNAKRVRRPNRASK